MNVFAKYLSIISLLESSIFKFNSVSVFEKVSDIDFEMIAYSLTFYTIEKPFKHFYHLNRIIFLIFLK